MKTFGRWPSFDLKAEFCTDPSRLFHGPQSWRWRFPVSLTFVRLWDVSTPSSGYRVWIYSRWGAVHASVFFDRRPVKLRGRPAR